MGQHVVDAVQGRRQPERFQLGRHLCFGGDEDAAVLAQRVDEGHLFFVREAAVAAVVGGLPGDEADDGVALARSDVQLAQDAGVGPEGVRVQVGQLLVAGVAHVLFAKVALVTVGRDDARGEGVGDGVLQGGVLRVVKDEGGHAGQGGGVHNEGAGDLEDDVRPGAADEAQQPALVLQQFPRQPQQALARPAQNAALQVIGIEQIEGDVFVARGDGYLVPVGLPAADGGAEEMDVGRMGDIHQNLCCHGRPPTFL